MSRNKKSSPLEDIVLVASKLPWWAGVILALISYLVLHSYATRPPLPMTGPGQMGAFAVRGLYTSLAMFGQYLLPFAFGLGALISAFNLIKQKNLYDTVAKRSGVGALNEMSWGDFERLVSEYYRRKGFQVTREGGNGPDGGIDLILRQKGETHLVQCKQWKAYKVGVQPVREFYGVMASRSAAGGYFVTSGEYTNEARAFAKGLNLELVDGRKLREMIDTAQQPALVRVAAVPSSPKAVPAAAAPKMLPVLPASPLCPRCNAEMLIRTARQGSTAGTEFWGCPAYPKCRGKRSIEGSPMSERPAMAVSEPVMAPPAPEKRNCPDCGTELVLRTFMSGPRNGEEFHACLPCKKGWPLSQANPATT